jgi:hypothetical protein
MLLSCRCNGLTRNDLLHCSRWMIVQRRIVIRLEQKFNQSTPERRSAFLSDEGLQPVTLTL